MLTIAFAGQAFAYYGLTAWLPTLLADEQGMTRNAAGAASSIFQVAALIGAFGTPLVINRMGGPLPAFVINGVLWSSLPLGLLWASDLWPLWSALGGAAQGGGFVAVFTVVVYRSRTLRENRQLSAIIQTGGYTIACAGSGDPRRPARQHRRVVGGTAGRVRRHRDAHRPGGAVRPWTRRPAMIARR